MKYLQLTLAGLAVLAVSACATPSSVSRGLSSSGPLLSQDNAAISVPSYRVSAVNVTVPSSLSVSEANSYKPSADIVWRGDPRGDRHQQVGKLVEEAISAGVAGLDGARAVVLDIQVTYFHALTERARYTVGGTHDIHFTLTVKDAATGLVLEPTRLIKTELNGLGSDDALAAEAQGQGQKVRITAHLKQLIRNELLTPRMVPLA